MPRGSAVRGHGSLPARRMLQGFLRRIQRPGYFPLLLWLLFLVVLLHLVLILSLLLLVLMLFILSLRCRVSTHPCRLPRLLRIPVFGRPG